MKKQKTTRIIFALVGLAFVVLGAVLFFQKMWGAQGGFERLNRLVFIIPLLNVALFFILKSRTYQVLITGLILVLAFAVFLNVYNYSDPMIRNYFSVIFLLTAGSELLLWTIFYKKEKE